MAIGVDSSKWKPRNLRGTPAKRFVTLIAGAIISIGVASGVFLLYSPLLENVRKNFEKVYEDPIVEVERRQLIASGLRLRTGDQVRKLMKEAESLDTPSK